MTKTEIIIEFLLSKGCIEIQFTSYKYRKFRSPKGTIFYWVGKSGGLRQGKTISNSISLTERVKKYLAAKK